jgi:hypothetical protein
MDGQGFMTRAKWPPRTPKTPKMRPTSDALFGVFGVFGGYLVFMGAEPSDRWLPFDLQITPFPS